MYSDDDDKISFISERISNHDYVKHVILKDGIADPERFIADLGIDSKDKYKLHIQSVLKNEETISYRITNGREFYYSHETNTLVIHHPAVHDHGTCFRPDRDESYIYGKNYFIPFKLKHTSNSTEIVIGGYSVQQEANKLADIGEDIRREINKSEKEGKETGRLEGIKKNTYNLLKELGKSPNNSVLGSDSANRSYRITKIKEYVNKLQKEFKEAKKELRNLQEKTKRITKKYDKSGTPSVDKKILSDCQKSKTGNELIKRLKKRGYTTTHDKTTGRVVSVDKKGATVDLEKVIKDGKKQKRLPADYKTGIDKEQLPDLEDVKEKNAGKGQSFDDSENPAINKKRQAILSDCMKSKNGKALTKRLERRGYTLALNPEDRHILVVDYKGRTIDLTEILDEGKRQNKVRESVVIKKENLPDVTEVRTENLKKLKKRYENFMKDAAADREDINSIYDKKKSSAKNDGDKTRIALDRDIELKNNEKKLERKIQRYEKRQETKMTLREKSLSRGLGI